MIEFKSDYNHCKPLQSDMLAAGLMAYGVKRGDRVGIWSPNYVEWILTQFATARAGMIMVGLLLKAIYWIFKKD